MSEPTADPFDVRLAAGAPEPLRSFNAAGVLEAADVHVALRLCALAGETRPELALATALAVRAPRLGHVLVDLASIATTAVIDQELTDVDALPWPAADTWPAALAASPLVAGEGARPLRLEGSELYLTRLWGAERRLAELLRSRARPVPRIDEAALAAGLDRLFAADDHDQRAAAALAVRRGLSVIAGGPGTGKTTAVARVVALLAEQARQRGERLPLIALATPTGKASARLAQAVHGSAAELPVDDTVRELLAGLEAVTLHRLLGMRPGGQPRFHREQRLPHEVVIVDETSMVSLAMTERLLAAVRPSARLVLLGDPGQLASVEAGAVLGDIASVRGGPLGDSIVTLDRVHRFGGTIAPLAAAIRAGDGDGAIDLLRSGGSDVVWLDLPPGADPAAAEALRRRAVGAGRALREAALAGDGNAALRALDGFRILCAHRRGPHGVSTLTARTLGWLAEAMPDLDPGERWFAGRPLLLTRTDSELGLFNGDTGVVLASPGGGMTAVFDRRGLPAEFAPARLTAIETVYAMTIHKSQGSQFGDVAVVLPPPDSRLLTRELLYTAVTRTRNSLLVIGGEASIRAAIARPIARASGLRRRLTSGGVANPGPG